MRKTDVTSGNLFQNKTVFTRNECPKIFIQTFSGKTFLKIKLNEKINK